MSNTDNWWPTEQQIMSADRQMLQVWWSKLPQIKGPAEAAKAHMIQKRINVLRGKPYEPRLG